MFRIVQIKISVAQQYLSPHHRSLRPGGWEFPRAGSAASAALGTGLCRQSVPPGHGGPVDAGVWACTKLKYSAIGLVEVATIHQPERRRSLESFLQPHDEVFVSAL